MIAFYLWGGPGFVVGAAEKFRSLEAAASEWVYRRRTGETCWGQQCLGWGLGVIPGDFVITMEGGDSWTIAQVEALAAL